MICWRTGCFRCEFSHEEALGHLAHADGKAFGFALGVMAGKMDQARQEIAGALKRLRDPEEKRL